MSDQDGGQATAGRRPSTEDAQAWKAYWQAQGQPWRTEPEIDAKRQEYLAKRRRVTPDIKQGIYPFKGEKLSRADVEWLLATHENGRGPVDWCDGSQREREGLDLRGANLCQTDLRKLPLTRMYGGLEWNKWLTATQEQREKAEVYLKGADLSWVHLEEAHLLGAHLERANLFEAHLERAILRRARLEGTNLLGAHLERANLRAAFFDPATNLGWITLGEEKFGFASLADVRWNGVDLSMVDWRRVNILGDEREARQPKASDGKIKEKGDQLYEYHAAVRANRQLAVALQGQGLNEEAARFAYRAHVLQWYVLHWQLPRQLEQVQWYSHQQEVGEQNSDEGEIFNLPGLFADLLDWPSFLLLEVAHTLKETHLLKVFLLALQLLALLYLVATPLLLFLLLLISLPFVCVWFLELIFSLAARLFPRLLPKQGHKQQRLQPLSLPLTLEQFKASISSTIRQTRVLSALFFETLKVHLVSLGSLLLDLLTGHGYKPGWTFVWYLVVVLGFALAYHTQAPQVLLAQGHYGPLSWRGAFILIITAFHGRGFFLGGEFGYESAVTVLAAIEAIVGLFIELSFIATFTQRFLGK